MCFIHCDDLYRRHEGTSEPPLLMIGHVKGIKYCADCGDLGSPIRSIGVLH